MDNHRQSPWTIASAQVLTQTNTNENGLTDEEVPIRQKKWLQ